MDDDDLIPWNPAHFGHTDFQKESDGQLTIFFEDSHEPPDPDDFASIADYEIAWTQWEQIQTLPQQEDMIMNFNITTSFDSEIEQLKVKLAELETQKHRISTRANKIVEQVGECVFEMKEAGVSDGVLSNWACLIYREVTGEDVPALSNADVLKGATAWEEKYKQLFAITSKQIAQLTTERDELSNKPQGANEPLGIDLLKKVSDLTIERDTALQKITDLTAASLRVSDELKAAREKISQLKSNLEAVEELQKLQSDNGETSDNSVIGGYKKTILELTTANQKLTEEILRLRGESPFKEILEEVVKPTEETDAEPEESEEDPRQNPEFLEATNNQEIVSEFLRKLDRIARVDKLDWQKIKELPLNLETMRELGLQVSSKSKTHKYLLEQMPAMCAKYINETGDDSDLDWLPGHFVESVREALSAESDNESTGEEEAKKSPRSVSLSEVKPTIQRGDTVRHLTHNGDCTVLDVNGEWLNVQDSDGLTDMWQVPDVELVAK